MKTKDEKAAAAYALSDELLDVELMLERAELLVSDMADSYFREYDETTEEGRFAICYDHPRYEIFTEIIQDYLCSIRKDLEALDKLVNAGREIAQAERDKAG